METRRSRNEKRGQSGNESQSGNKSQIRNKSRSKKKYGVLERPLRYLIPIAVASLLVILYMLRCGFPAPIQAQIDILPDRRAENGVLHGATGPIPPGEYQIVLNQLPTIESGSRDCNIEFENPEGNEYSSRINLYLKSTGKHIGGTRRVDPGNYVENVKLNTTLEAGEYPVLAHIELFQDKEPSGSMTLELTIRVVTGLSG